MYLRALEGYEKAWGPKHTSTLRTLNNLASLYQEQGNTGEAMEIYLRVLEGYEEALGPRHSSTLRTIRNLGSLYANQDNTKEAGKMYLRALRGYRQAEGDHEDVIADLQKQLSLLGVTDEMMGGDCGC